MAVEQNGKRSRVDMKLEKEQSWNLLRTFVCITIAGTLLHGLFDLWPSILTEFVAPVN